MRNTGTRTSGRPEGVIPLVGRAGELSRINAGLSRAAGGDPGVIVVSSLPGIGKSRLAAETLLLAKNAGFDTFIGHAGELGTSIAYAPFVEAFGPRLRNMSADVRANLLHGLSQLGLVISGLDVDEPRPLGDPALERMRIADGFGRLIERFARQKPIALLFEDAHVLDQESAALLSHLALTVDDKPLLLVLTTRSSEPDGLQLERVLTGMSSAGWWRESIELAPLEESDSTLLITGVLGEDVNEEVVRRILRRCGGVPRFLESIAVDVRESGHLNSPDGLRALEEPLVPLPADIRHRIALRLAELSADQRRIVELVALSGAHSEYAVLSAEEDDRATSEALEHLERLMFVTTAVDGGITLAHGILQEAVIDEMSPSVKRRRHAEIAESLRRHDENDPRIVEHLLRAGSLIDPLSAARTLRAAAQRATSVGANDDALRYLRAAIDVLPTASRSTRAELLLELGNTCVATGRRDDAIENWKLALQHYRKLGDPHGTTRVNRELAQLAWGDGNLGKAREYFDAAERAQEGLEPTGELAELLYARMIVATRDGDTNTVVELADRLRPIARRLRVPDMSVRLLLVEAAQELVHKDLRGADEKNTRALELADDADDLTLAMRAHDQLSVSASIRGDLESLRRHSEASLDAVSELGAVILQPWPRIRLAMADMLSGDWDRALRTSADVLAIVDRFGEQRGQLSALGTYAWLLVLRGRLSEADDALLPFRKILGESTTPAALVTAATALAIAHEQFDEAARLGAPLADFTGNWYPFPAAMLLGEALAHTSPDRAQELATRIRGWKDCGTPFPVAVASYIDGLSSTRESSIEAFRSSIDGFDSLGFPFLAAQSRFELADRCSRQEATQLAADALTVFDRLGATRHAQRARHLLRSHGIVPSRGRGAHETGAPFSKRELEVARLVASGSSNAQIATELFISPRTVTTHLDHIYSRLGLNSRTALTRYLADTGLLSEESAERAPHLIT